ncbi:MAG: DEAD/DEAH box helicase [Desulfomonilaceae bacterium]
MIIVHSAMHSGQLFLWGETSEPGQVREKPKSPQSRQKENAKRHCQGARMQDLVSALDQAFPKTGPEKKRFRDLAAWLPTSGTRPVPSSPLIAEQRPEKRKTKLCPWVITAYQMAWAEAVDFLCASSRKKVLAPGVATGDDLSFWSEALRFSGSLVARQQYLPSIETGEGGFLAVWKPVYLGNDTEDLTNLAQQMPPSARALHEVTSTAPPEVPAVDHLKAFLAGTLDHLVRSSSPEERPVRKRGKGTTFESIHDAWLSALKSTDNRISGDKTELASLATSACDWSRPIAVTASSPLRLCFRLEEPLVSEPPKRGRARSQGESWYVRYLLQPKDDLSLLLPVADTWNGGLAKTAGLKITGPEVTEYLLTSLGQASSICGGIAASLKSARPAGCPLDPQSAHDFLTEKALLLRQSGFGVMLPAWWTGKGTKLRLSLGANVKSPKMKASSGLSLGEIVQFDWEVAIGDQRLTLEQLESLAKLKAPLVRIRGQWVEISPDQIQAAADFLSKKESEKTTVRDVVQIALGAKEASRGLQLEKVKATGWVGSLLKQLENATGFANLQPDRSFSGELRPYQKRGLSWLGFLSQWGMGACLADDMGLGKTVQTLALIQRYRNSNGTKPVLLVCPTTVVNNWQKEASRFTPDLPVMIHHGVTRNRGAGFKKEVTKHAMVVSSYGLLYRDAKLFQDIRWSGLILDEAQNIKNPETQQARAAKSLKADYRIALTGTPVENNVGDLWSIMEFLNPGFLGSQAEFKRKFFVPIQAERDPQAAERLKRITAPFVLRRLKTDKSIITDLPDKMEMKVFCPLTKEQASLYKAVVKETEEELKSSEGIKRKGLILATLSKLKQVCNHPAHFLGDNSAVPGRSGKLARLTEMLEEVLEIGDRALIFSQFAEMGKLLQRHLQEIFGREVLFLHGSITKQNRDRMVERFQDGTGGPSIFVLSLKAGGTGLNLTSANHVFHFDRWWNPAVENQATDRAFRIGQTKNVQVHKFVCAGTLEEKIDEMIERKKDVAEKVVGVGERWITELSNKDLKGLWTLRKEAMGE